MNHTKEQINSQLVRILESKYFKKSKISCDLLSYLVNATLHEKELKEFTIGIELFGKKYTDEGKPDANIRVYIHNLRKKLQEYYLLEGKKDPIIFEIEKGKYTVHFKSPQKKKLPARQKYFLPFAISVTIAVVCVIVCAWMLLRPATKNHWEHSIIWGDFIRSDKATLLVLGDHFVFSGVLPTGKVGVYRDFSINSENDFEHLLDKQPDLMKQFNKSPLTYLPKMAVFCQNDILKILGNTQTDVKVKLSSDLQPTDLKDYNIIFVGNYKNMGLFESVIKEINFTYGIAGDGKQYITSSDPCASVYAPGIIKQKEVDYPMVIVRQGYNNNHFMLFLSSVDIGNISTVSRLASPDFVNQLETEHSKVISSGNYSMLFKVEGIDKTDLACELMQIE